MPEMKTPDEINEILSAQVDLEFPMPIGGFDGIYADDDARDWQQKKEDRFMELCRNYSEDE